MSKNEVKTEIPTMMVTESISLNVLLKFIKPFDGDRQKLSSFIKNCESALNLASSAQKDIIYRFILSQLEGKAELACSLKIFDNWQDLKVFLKTTFGETKHRDHLLIDLQNCKQKPTETVSQYSLRLETFLTRLQTDIAHSTRSPDELKGRIASTEDLALHTFLLGLPSSISTIVRCRNPTTLCDAINLAVQEEKLHNYIQSSRTVEPRPKCRSCGKLGHSERSCFLNRQRPIHTVSQDPKPSTSSYNNAPFSNTQVCRYCKNIGHDITECRKRQYNNSRRQRQPNLSEHKVHEICDENSNDNSSESFLN